MTLDLQRLLRKKLGNSITAVPCAIDLETLLIDKGLSDVEFDLHDHLELHHEVAAVWGIEDVRCVRPDLTEDQAWDVLKECQRVYDCNHRFNWLFIDSVAESLFPETSSPDTSGSEEA